MHNCRHTIILFALTLLFFARVVGQAVQRWLPQSFLPPFVAFQGGSQPYELLLLTQVSILLLMLRVTWGISRGKLVRRERTGHILAWVGGIYMTGSVARILIGVTLPNADAWFKAGIPAFFHLVLAGFIIVLARYNLSVPNSEVRKT